MSLIPPYSREDAGQPPSRRAPHASTVARAPRQPLARIPAHPDRHNRLDQGLVAVDRIVPPERRDTLVAREAADRESLAVWRFDIVLKGERETAFFDL